MATRRRVKPDPWQAIRAKLAAFAETHGLTVEARNPGAPQYQIALLTKDGVRLVVYPHTTQSTGHCHARIRDENSRDKATADRLMALSGLWIKHRGAWTAYKYQSPADLPAAGE